MFLKNVFTQFLTAFFEDDARNKKQGWEWGHGICC